jgi:hypothetical protein
MGPVTQDQQMGQSIGIHGTPTIFVNGVRFDGLRSAEEMETIIGQASRGELVMSTDRPSISVGTAVASTARLSAANQCSPR